MKVMAGRAEQDAEDIHTLCQTLGITTAVECLDIAEGYARPAGVLPRLGPRQEHLVRQVLPATQ